MPDDVLTRAREMHGVLSVSEAQDLMELAEQQAVKLAAIRENIEMRAEFGDEIDPDDLLAIIDGTQA